MHEEESEAIEEQIYSLVLLEDSMRSELVFSAVAHVPNRFLLIKLAVRATRAFHRSSTRVQKTVTDVIARLGRVYPEAQSAENPACAGDPTQIGRGRVADTELSCALNLDRFQNRIDQEATTHLGN